MPSGTRRDCTAAWARGFVALVMGGLAACARPEPTSPQPPTPDTTAVTPESSALAQTPVIGLDNVANLVPAARLDQAGVMAWSADATMFALAGAQGISFYEHQPGTIRLIAENPHTTNVLTMAFAPDGRTLATGGFYGGVQLWSATNGEPVISMWGSFQVISDVVFAPDGQTLIAHDDDIMRQWESANGGLLGEQGVALSGLSMSPDGEWIADIANSPAKVELRRLDGTVLSSVEVVGQGTNYVLFDLDLSPNGEVLATAGRYQSGTSIVWEIKLWSVQGGQLNPVSQFDPGPAGAQSIAFSPDGTLLATGGMGQTVQFWDAESRRLLHTLQVPADASTGIVEFSPDGRLFAVRPTVHLWEVATGEDPTRSLWLQELQQMGSDVWEAEERLSELGYLGSEWADGVFDETTAAAVRTFQEHNQLQANGVIAPDIRDRLFGSLAVAVGSTPAAAAPTLAPPASPTPLPPVVLTSRPNQQEVFDLASIWEFYGLSNALDLESPGSREFSVDVDPEATFIWPFYWCATEEGILADNLQSLTVAFEIDGVPVPSDHVLEYDAATQYWSCHYWATMLSGWQGRAEPSLTIRYVFSQGVNDGQRIYLAGEYSYTLRAIVGGERVSSTGVPQLLWEADSLAWSRSGNRIALGTEYGLVMYSSDLRQATPLGDPMTRIVGVAWSPDGARLASAEAAQRVTIWSAATRQSLATLTDFEAQLLSVAWSPDGQWLATGSGDHAIRIWNAETYSLARTVDGLAEELAWSPTGDRLAGVSGESLFVWDASTGELLAEAEVVMGARSVSWTPDGGRLITSGLDIWDAATGMGVGMISDLACAAGAEIIDVLSPDGSRIAGIGAQATGDVACVIPLASPGDWETWAWLPEDVPLEALAWSPDSRRLVSAGGSEVYVWDAETGEQLASATNSLVARATALPPAQPLQLEVVCSLDTTQWHWRVRNPNGFDVDIHWEWGDRTAGSPWDWVVVPAARNGTSGEWLVTTPSRGATDQLRFYSGAYGWQAMVEPNALECVP